MVLSTGPRARPYNTRPYPYRWVAFDDDTSGLDAFRLAVLCGLVSKSVVSRLVSVPTCVNGILIICIPFQEVTYLAIEAVVWTFVASSAVHPRKVRRRPVPLAMN